jgi:hypothetical protein
MAVITRGLGDRRKGPLSNYVEIPTAEEVTERLNLNRQVARLARRNAGIGVEAMRVLEWGG